MVEERSSRDVSSCTDDESSDDEASASPIGSVLTVKYKARNPLDATALPHNHPVSTGIICNLNDDQTENHHMLHAETASVLIKPPLKKFKKNISRRTVCLWASIFLSILLLGFICIGVLFWSSTERMLTSAQASSGVNFTSVPSTDLPCQARSSYNYLGDIFTLGYDLSKANPVRRKSLVRPVLEESLLHECQLTADNDCQPHAHSKVIDSLSAYHKWIRDQISLDPSSNDPNDQHILSSADDDYFQIQAELMAGHLLVMTHLSCPLLEVSHPLTPNLNLKFIQQLNLIVDADQESALDFTEDFGTHYVDRAVIGSQIIIRFTLNRTNTEFLKAKNVSLATQATAAGLYLLSRSNSSIHLSSKSAETALDFLAVSRTQFYSDAGDAVVDRVDSMQRALKTRSVLSLRLKPLNALFDQLDNGEQLSQQWQHTRQLSCLRLQARGVVLECNNSPDPDGPASFVLPFLKVATNGTSVGLRTPWNSCLELCRADPMCSAATICTVNCNIDEPNCALHRQQEFSNNSVSSRVVTVVPVRQDLRPVNLRGFTVYGHPLYSTNQLTDLASCTRLCSRTWHCQIVSFSHFAADHKICRLFYNMTRNELRHQAHSTVIFMMATFGPCFLDELKQKKDICTLNAECWNGMCVCKHGYYKNGTSCISTSSSNFDIEEMSIIKDLIPASTISPVRPSKTEIISTTRHSVEPFEGSTSASRIETTTQKSKVSTDGYYIRGVYVPAKSTPSTPTTVSMETTDDTGWRESTTVRASSGYKPWQMRSWGSANTANSDKTPAENSPDVKPTKSQWSLIRGR